ncbi:MAG: MarR family transcriptional regulator [Schwartzia sp.]|nr:MarR family transcriptional regulator [Schwartzia sp. (in: firmicutes)]
MCEDMLLLKNQLCFPIYACAREIIKAYHEPLSALNLTYTQYLVMMVLWEERKKSVRELGECLYLDSGTLTPLLKKLEAKGYIARERCPEDERCVIVSLTADGDALKGKAGSVPRCMAAKSPLTQDEAATLYKTLYKLLHTLHDEK